MAPCFPVNSFLQSFIFHYRFCFLVGFLTLSLTGFSQKVFYVTPTGGTTLPLDGASWATAYDGPQLQTVINLASAYSQANNNEPVQVWVAEGLYKTTSGTNRTISFSMRNNVAIYGGFKGNETSLAARPALHVSTPSSTTLSGEIGDPAIISDNAEMIFKHSGGLTNSAILDGVVISGGKGYSFGAGMDMQDTDSPTLRYCTFANNNAGFGAAVCIDMSSREGNCHPIFLDCQFIDNSLDAPSFGGAIYIVNLSSGICSPTFTNCIFTNNRGSIGAVFYQFGADGFINTTLTNCTFTKNGYSSSSTIFDNYARYQATINTVATNCTFADNKGIVNTYTEDQRPVTTSLTNCIIWNNNGADPFRASPTSNYTNSVNYSLLESGATKFGGANNLTLSTSPFVSETDLQLRDCSPAIDAGDPASTSATSDTTDLAGNPRFFNNGRIDPGAFEFQGSLPAITTNPPSASSVCAGSPVSVSVVATGNAPTYQWYKEGVSLGPEQQTATLSLPSAQVENMGSYVVVVTGCSSLTATPFVLTVNSLNAPVLHVSSSVTQPILQNTPFVSLTVSGCEGGTVNWQGPNGSSGNGTSIAVSTSATGNLIYSATCQMGSCTSATGSVTVTIADPTVTGSFDGFVNGADCGSFRGWAWDRNKPNAAISVDILDGAKVIDTVPAEVFRQDLKEAGKGNGIHAFRYTIPASLKDGLPHNLSARVAGSSFILKDSPKALICEGVPVPGGNKAPVPPSPTVLIAPLVAQMGVPFSGTLVAFTDPESQALTYQLSGLPGGLSINASTRVISGTPTEAGTFVLAYSASDGQLTNSVSFPLTVNPASTTTVTGSFEGYLDKVECGTILGWVWDRKRPNTPLTVEFYQATTQEVFGSTLANIYRDDLKNAGKGNGTHAYSFTVPNALKDGNPRPIMARVLGSTYDLKGGPKMLTCFSPVRLSAEGSDGLQVTVLGNPVLDQLQVEIRGAEGQPLRLQLTDARGRLVSQQQIDVAKAIEQQTFAVSQQPTGLLLLRVSSGLKSVTLNVLK